MKRVDRLLLIVLFILVISSTTNSYSFSIDATYSLNGLTNDDNDYLTTNTAQRIHDMESMIEVGYLDQLNQLTSNPLRVNASDIYIKIDSINGIDTQRLNTEVVAQSTFTDASFLELETKFFCAMNEICNYVQQRYDDTKLEETLTQSFIDYFDNNTDISFIVIEGIAANEIQFNEDAQVGQNAADAITIVIIGGGVFFVIAIFGSIIYCFYCDKNFEVVSGKSMRDIFPSHKNPRGKMEPTKMKLLSDSEVFRGRPDVANGKIMITDVDNKKMNKIEDKYRLVITKEQVQNVSEVMLQENVDDGRGFTVDFTVDSVKDTLLIYDMNSKIAKTYRKMVNMVMVTVKEANTVKLEIDGQSVHNTEINTPEPEKVNECEREQDEEYKAGQEVEEL